MDRRTRRKLARCKTDAMEVDGVWWFRDRSGKWLRADEMPEPEQDDEEEA